MAGTITTPQGTDYSGTSGSYEEEVDDLTYLDQEEEDDDFSGNSQNEEEEEEDDPNTDPDRGAGQNADEDEDDDKDDPAGKGSSTDPNEEGNTQFKNIPALLNQKYFGGKLNMDNLPEDLTREQEAEVVAGLFDKSMQQMQQNIKQYEEVDKLLQDEEVVEFLKYRKAGRSLKELVADKAAGTSGEALLVQELREKNPDWDDEDIQDQLELWKTKGKLDKFAQAAKERREVLEAEQIKTANATKAEQDRIDAEKRQQDASRYQQFVAQQKEFAGLPLDEQMQQDLVTLATGINPKTGNVLIEDFLENDKHVMAASIGILFMDRFAKQLGTKKAGKQAASLVERLFDNPGQLNTRKKATSQQSDAYIEAANSF